MSSIKRPSQVELTRLKSIAERLGNAYDGLSAPEIVSEVLSGNSFVKNPVLAVSYTHLTLPTIYSV